MKLLIFEALSQQSYETNIILIKYKDLILL